MSIESQARRIFNDPSSQIMRLQNEVAELRRENAALREDKERLDELLKHGVVGWYAGPRKWIGDQKITRCYTREDIDSARAKEAQP